MDESLKSDRLRTDPQHSREERKRGSGGLEEEMIHANRSEMCKKKREKEIYTGRKRRGMQINGFGKENKSG